MNDEAFSLGLLRVRVGGGKTSEPTVYTLAVDRLAASRQGLLYLLGVVGPYGTVKSLRMALNAKVKSEYSLSNVPVTDGKEQKRAGGFHTDDKQKFAVHVHPLGYGQVHALFLAIDPQFIRVISDEAVFAALKQTTFTTPILRSWVPALAKSLKDKGLLDPLWCFRCQCGIITAEDEHLDASVTDGVKSGSLLFNELNLVGV